jgi:hypothetical protein
VPTLALALAALDTGSTSGSVSPCEARLALAQCGVILTAAEALTLGDVLAAGAASSISTRTQWAISELLEAMGVPGLPAGSGGASEAVAAWAAEAQRQGEGGGGRGEGGCAPSTLISVSSSPNVLGLALTPLTAAITTTHVLKCAQNVQRKMCLKCTDCCKKCATNVLIVVKNVLCALVKWDFGCAKCAFERQGLMCAQNKLLCPTTRAIGEYSGGAGVVNH